MQFMIEYTERRSETWKRSPEEALQRAFDEHEKRAPYQPQTAFLSVSLMGRDGKTRYGSFKYVKKSSLVGRRYEIQFWDGQVTIHLLDVVHNERTCKSEWIDKDREGCPPEF